MPCSSFIHQKAVSAIGSLSQTPQSQEAARAGDVDTHPGFKLTMPGKKQLKWWVYVGLRMFRDQILGHVCQCMQPTWSPSYRCAWVLPNLKDQNQRPSESSAKQRFTCCSPRTTCCSWRGMESFQTTGKCLVSAFLRKLLEKVEQFDITGPTTKKAQFVPHRLLQALRLFCCFTAAATGHCGSFPTALLPWSLHMHVLYMVTRWDTNLNHVGGIWKFEQLFGAGAATLHLRSDAPWLS